MLLRRSFGGLNLLMQFGVKYIEILCTPNLVYDCMLCAPQNLYILLIRVEGLSKKRRVLIESKGCGQDVKHDKPIMPYCRHDLLKITSKY